MKATIVIPARFNSSRFPGKPLQLIRGKSLLFRTWSLAKSVNYIDQIYITTDDIRIRDHALAFGAEVIMTSSDCENGTERVYQALKKNQIFSEIVINLQGDAVLTPPWVIQSLLNAMLDNHSIQLGTVATSINKTQYDQMVTMKNQGEVGGTSVVFDLNHNALYFSKAMIPFCRNRSSMNIFGYRHIGLYGFRFQTLEQYLHLEPSPLEKIEGLEQLRALEHGIPIKIILVDYRGRTPWAVDSIEDIKIVETIINKEGELFEVIA